MTHRITVLSKQGCHLCERAIETLAGLSGHANFELEIVDISKDENLFGKYFLKIPVVQLDGQDVFQVEQIALPDTCKKNLGNLVANLR